MELDEASETTMMRPQMDQSGEARMVDQERWAEIRRLFHKERVSISEIGRRLDVDRKTVRRSLRQAAWTSYHRAAVAETLLTAHTDFVRDHAPQVNYSARILYQELRASRGCVAVETLLAQTARDVTDAMGRTISMSWRWLIFGGSGSTETLGINNRVGVQSS
jgi:predicted DNA-binding protein (UPF0251 family)